MLSGHSNVKARIPKPGFSRTSASPVSEGSKEQPDPAKTAALNLPPATIPSAARLVEMEETHKAKRQSGNPSPPSTGVPQTNELLPSLRLHIRSQKLEPLPSRQGSVH